MSKLTNWWSSGFLTFPGLHVVLVQLAIEPADQEVIHDRQRKTGCEGIIYNMSVLDSDNSKMGGNLHEEMYPRMVILDDSCRLHQRKVMKSRVKGPRYNQVYIGLNTSSLQPYAYFSQRVSSS